MEEEILKVADYAMQQPGVTGYICVGNDGLCIVARGEANQSMSGIVHQIALLASKLEESSRRQTNGTETKQRDRPVIKVDFDRYKMVIQSRDSCTTALISPRN